MVVVLSPGQGSQSVGMLAPWLELPGADERIARWSDIAGLDLRAAGTTWSADEIRDTAVAQPLLTAAALLSATALLGEHVPAAVCGHSIGELPALAVAGVLSPDDAVALAALRGRAMAQAAQVAPTGMAAVLGGDADEVLATATALGLEVATVNVAGQVVLGGPAAALQALADAPPAGARVRPLDVAGAFHTSAMSPATEAFGAALQALAPGTPRTAIVANRDGKVVTDGAEALHRLLDQLTSPVRFDLCLIALATAGIAAVVELAPGGTLSALAKRALPGAQIVALKTPDDLAAARALLHPAGEQTSLEWRTLQSPDSGVVDPLAGIGQRVAEGDTIALIAGRSGAHPVLAPVAGTVTEWLVSPGDPVRAGQTLAVLA
ncbi:MAG: biotin attachment protein [Frankiales bacterium]|nr:biotin attachment protein [Frankiales bacterium]